MKLLLLSVFAVAAISVAAHAQPAEMPMQQAGYFGFLENKGQVTDQYGGSRPDIDFRLSSGNITVFIGYGHIHYQWSAVQQTSSGINEVLGGSLLSTVPSMVDIYRMDVQLLGAGSDGLLVKEGRQPYMERYYLPQCGPEGAIAQSYEKIVYKEVYPYIDWVLYIREGKLEQDFVVHPGGNVADIRMQFKGVTGLGINEDGSFTATTPFGSISEAAPYSFQEDNSRVASAFVLSRNELGFNVADFNGRLTIDPTVSWATYIGGGGGIADQSNDMEVSVHNELYLGGWTNSAANVATTGSHQVTYGGMGDGFLMKFGSEGNLLWSTYYGGVETDEVTSVSCDSLGNAYIAGRAHSNSGIATGGSHQSLFGGGTNDLFFAKFDSSGARIFGSYYGGNESEGGLAKIVVDGDAFFLSGATNSTSGIATSGAHQVNYSDIGDAFLAKFSLDGVREWGTYYGGPGSDAFANSLACDNRGNVYLFGTTRSESGIATPGAHKPAYVDATDNGDHFLAKFNRDGVRQWATYYGGEGEEPGHFAIRHIGCDPLGNVYMTGPTMSASGIASEGSYQDVAGGAIDNYLAKFDSNGVRQWATYYGGAESEWFPSLRVADTHIIYMVGGTASGSGIATVDALQPSFAGGVVYGDAFLARFNNNGEHIYGTYYGGSGIDCGASLAVDRHGYLYLCGIANSVSGIATPDGYQSNYPGSYGYDGFLAKFCFAAPASVLDIEGADSICRESQASYSLAEVGEATAYIWTLPDGWSGSSNSNTIDITSGQQSGIIGLQVVRCEDTSDLAPFPVYVFPADPAVITVDNFTLGTVGTYASYQWLFNGQPLPDGATPSITVVENGDYSVITVNEHGCTDTSEVYTVSNVGIEDVAALATQISIFPNPAAEQVFIQSPVKLLITVTTVEGKVLTQVADEKVIDISSYAAGVYMLRLATADGEWIRTEKIVKIQ